MTAAVTVVGEALIDLVGDRSQPGRFDARTGGSPLNVATTAARLGVDVELVARVGEDAFGGMLRARAASAGIGLTHWQTSAEPTSLALANLDEDGSADYVFYLDGTAALGFDAQTLAAIPLGRFLHTGSLASWHPRSRPAVEALQARAHGGGVVVSYDPNARPSLMPDPWDARAIVAEGVALSHLVKASDEDVEYLYPGLALDVVAHEWTNLGAALVVITLGSDGAVAYTPAGEVARVAAPAVNVVDTVGAGDAFTGGLLAALGALGLDTPDALHGADGTVLTRAMQRAVLVAAMTCERAGADPPQRAAVEARLGSDF